MLSGEFPFIKTNADLQVSIMLRAILFGLVLQSWLMWCLDNYPIQDQDKIESLKQVRAVLYAFYLNNYFNFV